MPSTIAGAIPQQQPPPIVESIPAVVPVPVVTPSIISPYPTVYPVAAPVYPDDYEPKNLIRKQIDYYFSADNLQKDFVSGMGD